MNLSRLKTNKALICSLLPYFLEKDFFWFEKNIKKILEARKSQSFFKENTILFVEKEKANLSQALRKLDEMGYEKVFRAQEPGEFSHRGGLIDIFPINSDSLIQVEFLGNEIESIYLAEETKIKDPKKTNELLRKKLKAQKLFSDLKGIKKGEYLVHLDHGIARFLGIENWKSIFNSQGQKERKKNYYVLEYAQNDKLYVPLGLEKKLSRYVGFVDPKISRLGSSLWQRTKRKIKEESEKLAKELLELYAQRIVSLRSPYLPEDEFDFQITNNFDYEETPDQIQTLEEIKKDLEKKEPMDRIVCGDVGFGKTEIALRTMIKAVKSGYQTSMICPTTILANQHFQNFKKRIEKLPVRIALLSRLQSRKEQKEIIENLKKGKTDIVIGTHRILSRDVEFKNLGLLVIDDEQRFGVKQKEKLKKIRSSLDVLSLSATPIPRTLYMALSSLKNISLIQTPPPGRMAIETFISPFSEKTIKRAIESELSRQGQVYYLHNRIETIKIIKDFLEKLVPGIKIGIAHGRLREKELIKVMDDFGCKKTNLLLATTIIENGLDLANVNTLIVAEATRLGLAQAYQLRGRVGRSHIPAFAYFLYGSRLSEKAKLRLKALKEAKELGSGYKVALKDLEIRGAGNILGKEQSGSINKVGLNLYCQMLSQAIEKLKMNR